MLSHPVTWLPTKTGCARTGPGSFGNVAVLLRFLMKALQVVADDFRHAGGAHRDHVGLVEGLGILQASNMFFWPPKTAASSVMDGHAGDGSLKWRISRCGNRRRSPASRARRAASSRSRAASTAPRGWHALAGLTVSASRLKFFSWYSWRLVHSRLARHPPSSAGSRKVSACALEHLLVFRLAEELEMVEHWS